MCVHNNEDRLSQRLCIEKRGERRVSIETYDSTFTTSYMTMRKDIYSCKPHVLINRNRRNLVIIWKPESLELIFYTYKEVLFQVIVNISSAQ